MEIRFAAIYENDNVVALGRIIDDSNGLWGQSWFDGKWIRDDVVLSALFSPGSVDLVTDGDAAEIAARLSIPFPPSSPRISD